MNINIVKQIDDYITRCFSDAFIAHEREYNSKFWNFRFVLVKNRKGMWQLLPLHVWCKYALVQRTAEKRIDRNLMKNFGVHYGRHDELRFLVYEGGDVRSNKYGQIDFDHNQGMFKLNKGGIDIYASLSIFDEDWDEAKRGECMIAWKYEKLLFNYWKIDAETYRNLPKDDERNSLPFDISKGWEAYWKLYRDTFNEDPGARYEIVCGPGVEKVIISEDDDNGKKN